MSSVLKEQATIAAIVVVDRWLRVGYAEATVNGERIEVHPGQAAAIAYQAVFDGGES